MGERTNSFITIVAGLPEGNGVHVDGHASASRRREIAERLRKQGWSYRRIADALSVPYATIQVWLDGETVQPPVALVPRTLGGPRLSVVVTTDQPAPTPAPILPENHVKLLERIDLLAAEQQRQADAMIAMEKRILSTLRAEIKNLGQKLMQTIKTLKPKSKTGQQDPG